MERLKRKPYLIGMVLGAVALVFAAVMLAKPGKAEAPRLEQYLPADTVGFVQVSNLRGQALHIIESDAWRAFSRENQSASSLLLMGLNHSNVLDASYAVALLGTETDAQGKPRPSIVLVGEFDDETDRREFQQMYMQLGRRVNAKGVEANSEEYSGAKVTVVKEQGETFTYAQGDKTFLLSTSTDAVKKVLDVRAGKAKSLETNETFLRARTRTASREGMFGFLDGAALARLVETAPAAMSEGHGAAMRQLFEGLGLKSLESVAMSSAFADGRVIERVSIAAPNAEGLLKTVAQNPPTQRTLLALVPADALQAFDASVAGAPQVFDELFALAEQAAPGDAKQTPAGVLREFTEKTGIDLRGEIVGALGAEVAAAQLASGDDRGGVFIISLKDEAAFTQALDKMAQRHKATVTARDYKGVTVRQMKGEKGDGSFYAFVNGNFVGSGDAFAVERVIDTAQGGASLLNSDSFRAAAAGVEGNPQFVYYSSNVDYVARLGAQLTSKDYEFKKTTDGASSLRPSFAFGVARADGFYVESRTPLGTFPRILAGVASRLPSDKKAAAPQPKPEEKKPNTGE